MSGASGKKLLGCGEKSPDSRPELGNLRYEPHTRRLRSILAMESMVRGRAALSGGVYLRGWLALRRRRPERWNSLQAMAFVAGLAAVFLALASPIEPFASFLLSVHMVQHLLLMMVAPALIWLGAPLLPMVRGLPKQVRRNWVGPFLRSKSLRRVGERLTHPLCALPIFVVATWLWHAPTMYELALRSIGWHYVEHACFLAAALVFWYPVVRPYPSRPHWSSWLLIPYLILADVQNTVLSALLTFSDHVLYPYYTQVPRLAGITALADQATAGVIMWVPGSVAFLLPLFWIGLQTLYGKTQLRKGNGEWGMSAGERQVPACRYVPLPVVSSHEGIVRTPGYDLLRLPLLGRFLRWSHARLSLQLFVALLAVVVIYDGFAGPQLAPMNLAGVLPWIHWRGLLILGLLVLGNVFCLACPFTLPRRLAQMAARRMGLAPLATQQVAGRGARHPFPLVVRSSSAVGSAGVDSGHCGELLRGGFRRRQRVSRRGLLQVSLPDRPVQFRAIAGFTMGSESSRSRRLRFMPHARLHSRPRIASRLPTVSVPAAQDGKHGLHILSRLCSCLPARQHWNSLHASGPESRSRHISLGRGSTLPATGPGSAGGRSGFWGVCQCCWNGWAGRRVAQSMAGFVGTGIAVACRQLFLFARPDCDSRGVDRCRVGRQPALGSVDIELA